jgi:hypothetical protein
VVLWIQLTSSSKDGIVCAEAMEGSILHADGHDTSARAVFVHDQICSEVLNEEHGVVTECLRKPAKIQ